LWSGWPDMRLCLNFSTRLGGWAFLYSCDNSQLNTFLWSSSKFSEVRAFQTDVELGLTLIVKVLLVFSGGAAVGIIQDTIWEKSFSR
jgi:hypothetical protein